MDGTLCGDERFLELGEGLGRRWMGRGHGAGMGWLFGLMAGAPVGDGGMLGGRITADAVSARGPRRRGLCGIFEH